MAESNARIAQAPRRARPTLPPHDDKAIYALFEQYAHALTTSNAPAMGAQWVLPALLVGDEGARAVLSVLEVETFFVTAARNYLARGVVQTRAEVLHTEWLTERIAVVDVRWPGYDRHGIEIGAELARYTLWRDDADALRIRAVVLCGSGTTH